MGGQRGAVLRPQMRVLFTYSCGRAKEEAPPPSAGSRLDFQKPLSDRNTPEEMKLR